MEYLSQLEELLPIATNHIRDIMLHNEEEQDVWILVRNVLNLIKPLCLESKQYYLQSGQEGMNRYNTAILDCLKKYTEYLNNLIGENNHSYIQLLERYKKTPDKDHTVLVFNKNKTNIIEYSILLNRMFFFLQARFNPDTQNSLKPIKQELTKRQKAIVLHFKGQADGHFHQRQELIEQDNGNMKLYNIMGEVRKGIYSNDDLEAAIESLTEFPKAHALAIIEFKKRNPVT